MGGLAGGFLAAVAALVVVTLVTGGRNAPPPPGAQVPVVASDSHYLSDAGPDAPVLVEFLDFECEACAAAYPLVEQIREEYDGRLSVVARYFPLPGHANAENAAVAVEAAAGQGAFEAMYQRMYATQAQWGEQQQSQADLFRTFAADLGLDLAAYDAAVADPGTLSRVGRDLTDGQALGVQSTPTFFLDGQRIEPTSIEDFRAQVDAALAQRR
ncbi:thioredoxin domain-containing protein [Pseudokineococcus marinus]|uniref:Thioredoxin domain-containing protein n=1 Tax=Pseudokineococcus marinus TaxID=351215 RepID=A0A849BQ99_9ACTN|nr:thioredoxin domain-containing protein [Pseudokineococcus marinus]